jgi:hypothetical protein
MLLSMLAARQLLPQQHAYGFRATVYLNLEQMGI